MATPLQLLINMKYLATTVNLYNYSKLQQVLCYFVITFDFYSRINLYLFMNFKSFFYFKMVDRSNVKFI